MATVDVAGVFVDQIGRRLFVAASGIGIKSRIDDLSEFGTVHESLNDSGDTMQRSWRRAAMETAHSKRKLAFPR